MYIFGGGIEDSCPENENAWEYSARHKFRPIAPMREQVYGAACAVWKEHVLITGGVREEDEEYVATTCDFDTRTGEWSYHLPPLPREKAAHVSAVVGDFLYVIGGSTHTDFTNDTFRLNLSSSQSSWERMTPVPKAANAPGCAVYEDKIFLLGGMTNTVQCYDTTNDTWSFVAPMLHSVAMVAFATQDRYVYVAGGFDSDTFLSLNTLQRYDVLTDTWTLLAPMPTARSCALGCMYQGRFYVFGGRSTDMLDVVESYDPASDTWQKHQPMPYCVQNPTGCYVEHMTV